MDINTGLPILDNFFSSPLSVVFFLLAVIFALTIHEFAHAFVAAKQGDPTARYLGRVSLNPARHLDPIGSLMFLVAGIGWAKPVPVNPANLKDGKLGDFYVSIAGIVTNLIAAFIFALPLQIIRAFGGEIGAVSIQENIGLQFCSMIVYVNLLLAAFNLLPLPPLDGSKALGILVPRQFERQYQEFLRVGPALLIGLLLLAFVFKINLLAPIIDKMVAVFGYLTFLPTSLGSGSFL